MCDRIMFAKERVDGKLILPEAVQILHTKDWKDSDASVTETTNPSTGSCSQG